MSDIKRISTAVKTEPVKQEQPKPIPGTPKPGQMTNEYIVGKLFSFYNTAHFYHFQTDNHATHKALEHLYERLVHLNDEISEFLLGMQVPMRFKYITIDDVKSYNETELLTFLNAGCEFGRSLCEFADDKQWEALEDMAGHVCKEFNHAKLLISYK